MKIIMKKLINLSALICFVLFTTAACDVLDMSPTSEIPEEDIWDDPGLMEAFISDMYYGMGHGLYEVQLSAATDEAHFIHGYGIPDIVESTVTPSNRGSFGDRGDYNHWDWGDLYSRIRQTNVFLDNIGQSTIEDQALIDRMSGEVHFLRAYFYHNLLRIYGGVPVVAEAYDLEDDLLVPRNSFGETVDFIVAEADSAAALLPLEYTGEDIGRATRGAALALKSRVLLYAASDLYHENPGGMPETGYTGGVDRQQMWQAAKDAAEAVMDLGIYSLFSADPAEGDSTAQNYYELFITQNNEEVIMERFFIPSRDDGYNPGLQNGPNGYHNWAGNTPIQQLVDDYQMADGSEFDWGNPAHAAAPYENRDPRFYGTILYDGAEWRERPPDVENIDPLGVIQTFSEVETPEGTYPGVDTRDSPIEDWNGGYSGYYLRKWIDESVPHSNNVKQSGSWFFFRYAEILLNYAEASIELGDEDDARRELNSIRRRAGMPEFGTEVTGQELMDEYRNERRIEMAFEEQRYFDVRRWMIAPDVMDEDAAGITITAEAANRSDRSTYTNYEYNVNVSIQARSWNDKMYFQPIPLEEINRNDLLVQNPNY